jgi:hypothetical protein
MRSIVVKEKYEKIAGIGDVSVSEKLEFTPDTK